MPDVLPPLIAALLDPARYPHPAASVALVETHASWILLAGEVAYKLKKPITLPFLDYGTLARREACCRAELELNRRLAPDLYQEVVPIGGTEHDPRLGARPAIEWAVRMQRFDEAGRLDHVAARGELHPEQLAQLAATVHAFHAAAASAAPGSRFGTPAAVIGAARENFVELRELLAAADQPLVERLAVWTEEEFARRRADFVSRKSGNRIREGHGDLHLGNLALIGGRVVPFDCIEFNDDFRWNDPASEVAFVWIDLLDHGKPGLAAWFLTAWMEASGDVAAMAVLPFYAVYRAVVRAKVAALRSRQESPADAERELAAARDYLALAMRIAAPQAPTLEITCGLSGSGKTTASTARLLASADGRLIRVRSDVERKRLFGLNPLDSSAAVPGGIYGEEANRRTYGRLGALARTLLVAGWPVIVDAAFLRRSERLDFSALAAEAQVEFRILLAEAPVETLRQRLQARTGDASEATLAVLEHQIGWFEPPGADEPARRANAVATPGKMPDA